MLRLSHNARRKKNLMFPWFCLQWNQTLDFWKHLGDYVELCAVSSQYLVTFRHSLRFLDSSHSLLLKTFFSPPPHKKWSHCSLFSLIEGSMYQHCLSFAWLQLYKLTTVSWMATAVAECLPSPNSWVEFFHPQCQVQDMNWGSKFSSANGGKFQ